MIATSCGLKLNVDNQELEANGTPMFPCACYCSHISHTGTGDIPWHWHEAIELVVAHCGSVQITADYMNFILHEGEGAFINSNVLHSVHSKGAGDCILHSFVFHSNLICGMIESVFQQKYIRPLLSCCELPGMILRQDMGWQTQALQCIREAYIAFNSEDFGYEFVVRELLTKVCFLIVQNRQDILVRQVSSRQLEAERIKEMLTFISRHYGDSIELKQIADHANISQRECLRCFQKMIGSSPMQYLIKYRISASARLLRETDQAVTEICGQCGFSSPSYFSKMFKRLMRCSPSEFRKQQ
ncbi:helix-turn-helix domain-containing protein [Oscillospiraceae bacterium PP1C4]